MPRPSRVPRASSSAVAFPESARSRAAAVALAWLHIATAVAFRIFCVLRSRVDSDEPQHLHVAWEWTRGFLPYRDFFDNHMPLFHLVASPLLATDRRDILLHGRLAMLPLAIATIALVYFIARRLYDADTAFWCALATSVMPPLVIKSVEFRNDNLWTPLCLAAALAVLGPLTSRRAFVAGVLLGLAFLTSIKTGIFGSALLLGVGTALVHGLPRRTSVLRLAASAAAGFAIVTAAMALWFASRGVLDDLVYCTFEFNRQLDVSAIRRWSGAILFLPLVALAIRYAAMRAHGTTPARLAMAMTCVFYFLVILGFWPLITARDFLSVIPLLAIFFTVAVLRRIPPLAAHAMPAVLIVFAVQQGELHERPSAYYQQIVAETLRFTAPRDLVLDLKGEAVFRRRPTYVILERVSRELLRNGTLPDRMAADAVANRCYVAVRDNSFFPPATRRFLQQHFVDVGELRIAGQRVARDGSFAIVVPGPYTLVDAHGVAEASRWYEAGRHRTTSRGEALTALWSPAVERGARPER